MSDAKTLFYVWDAATDASPEVRDVPADWTVSTWRPATDGPPPAALRGWQNRIWWLFDRLGLFANRGFGVLMIREGDRLIHSSLVTPRYFRFPEMAADDLQIGATWTDPDMRGRGLGKLAVALIHKAWQGEFRRMWYLVGDDNVASVRVIEASGYRLLGTGSRQALPGLGLLGRYRIAGREA